VGGWWKVIWLWLEVWGKPLSRSRHSQIHLGGIIRIVFGLGTRCATNVGTK
jgi:hypothetical protein